MSFWCPWLGILAAVITAVIVVKEVVSRSAEGEDFKKKIIREALVIVNLVVSSTDSSPIKYDIWSSRNEGFQTDVLGNRGYMLWKEFYDRVEERNQHYLSGKSPTAIGGWETFQKFNQAILNSFLKLHDGIAWVKQAVPEECVSNLLSRAKRSACV